MILKDQGYFFPVKPLNYDHKFQVNIKVDGLPYAGIVEIYGGSIGLFLFGGSTSNGLFTATALPEVYANRTFSVIITKDGRPYASQPYPLDNVVVHEIEISTSGGGGAPTGDPATISGKVERVLDNQAEAAARQLVAIEHKPDGSWAVTGNTTSDAENGSYTLEVLTEGGDTFVLAVDEYGVPFTATASVVQGDIIHPTVPNGHVYRVEAGGTLPATEPTWWIDTGTNHTRTIEGGITLRAIPFYRPLSHGPIKAEPLS
ncbi:hypothetical protein [Endozoicomonas sp. SESOKO1]|uniref:hypothetical protein n=1 Tax=Endozoicomonas sp. SESOKO1 TaxID=2828742 RepID=UPI00214949CD|nr:hypothetical protein [Endozoicomonas sp. SESOKO1]